MLTTNPQTNITTLVDQYLYYCEHARGLETSTLVSYSTYLRRMEKYLKKSDIRELSGVDLDMFFIDCKKGVSVVTVNLIKRVVKAFLKWCMTYVRVEVGVRASEIRETKTRGVHPKVLTHAQIRTVIKRTRDRQDKLIVSLMYESGLRISEVINVQVGHLRGRTLDVVGKGGAHRITFMTAKLAKQIHVWMDENGWKEGHIFRPIESTRWKTDRFMHIDSIRQRVKKLFKTIVAVDMHPHMLRHAFALRLLQMGCSLRSIQKLLGHANIETTMIYLQISDDYLEKEHGKFFGTSVYA